MHNEKFQSAAQDFLRKLHTDTAMNLERWQERRQRRTFYQSFTREKILSMREDDFYEYISRLWAMLIWGNKKYVVDKLIEDNGFETIKRFLADLLFGSKPVHNRWDSFLKEIKGMGPATVSELLCYQDPQNFIIANRTTATCFQYLGIPGMPRRNYQFTGARYLEVCRSAKQLAEALPRSRWKRYGSSDGRLFPLGRNPSPGGKKTPGGTGKHPGHGTHFHKGFQLPA